MFGLEVGKSVADTVAVVITVRTSGLIGVPGEGRGQWWIIGSGEDKEEDDFYLNVSVWVARMFVMRTGQALTTSLHFSLSLLLSSEQS